MLVDLDVLCRNIKMPLKVPTLSCCFSQLEILTLRLPMHKPHDIAQSNFPKMLELKKLTVHYSANLDESLLDLTTFMRISPNLEEFVLMENQTDRASQFFIFFMCRLNGPQYLHGVAEK
ncbi:unnamed protein product [Cuscuta epithymum]|uniref:FBD domain-containing protein n=1 Tax=Cuscuta epithymum TaxID=186058 RepID=A0AAV0EBW8_9ASTE|nr:unnamed protein product [Cuscuta epithymum]